MTDQLQEVEAVIAPVTSTQVDIHDGWQEARQARCASQVLPAPGSPVIRMGCRLAVVDGGSQADRVPAGGWRPPAASQPSRSLARFRPQALILVHR